MRIRKPGLMLYLVAVVALSLALSMTVHAAPQMDMEQKVSLTIRYDVDRTPVSGIEFRLYRVADISTDGKFTATDDFAGYALSFDALTSDDWTVLAGTLEEDVAKDRLEPAMRGKTDAQGTIFFSDCLQGLYLLVGDKHTLEDCTYTPQSLLVSLPSMYSDGGWEYEVISEPKFSSNSEDDQSSSLSSDSSGDDRLPQTGQLQWPIPVMFLLGTGVFLTGYFYRRRVAGTGDEDEQKE